MTFLETIEKMGYIMKEQQPPRIIIEKETFYSVLTIIFNMDKKYMNAALQPKRYICSEKDLDSYSEDFSKLKRNLDTFKGLCNYAIIMNTQGDN